MKNCTVASSGQGLQHLKNIDQSFRNVMSELSIKDAIIIFFSDMSEVCTDGGRFVAVYLISVSIFPARLPISRSV
jgi:hypothetical protein